MKQVEVSEWGLSQMRSTASANALTYITHFGLNGLIGMDEFNTMEKWRKLAADLSGEEFEPMDPEKGKIREFDASKILPPDKL